MGRWRPPQTPGSPYITRAGFERLRAEADELWLKRRPAVVKALAAAAAEGDRSENAEYIYRKKELAGIDRRIRFLRKRLDILKAIDPSQPQDPQRVYFAAWVCIEDEDGNQQRLRIVGPDEFDADAGYISMDSPMAKALMGKRLDDEITVALPEGPKIFYITEVNYQQA